MDKTDKTEPSAGDVPRWVVTGGMLVAIVVDVRAGRRKAAT